MTIAQIPGHLYGPPACHIAFWYGDHYLGEVRGHPSDVGAAHAKLMRSVEMLSHGEYWCSDRGTLARLAKYDRAMVYCGNFAISVNELRARDSRTRLAAEEAAASALHLMASQDFNKASWH